METKTALLIGFNFVLYFLSFLLPFRFAFSFFLTLALILDNYYFLYSPSKNLYFLFFFFLTIFFLTNSDSIHNQYLELFPFSGHGNFSTILENIKTISKLYCKKQWTLPHNPIIRGGIYFLDHTKYLTSLQDYVCKLPSTSSLFIYGPQSVGKSFGLSIMKDHWKEQGRLILRISLKGYGIHKNMDSIMKNILATIRIALDEIYLSKNDFIILDYFKTIKERNQNLTQPYLIYSQELLEGTWFQSKLSENLYFTSWWNYFTQRIDWKPLGTYLESFIHSDPIHFNNLILLLEIMTLRHPEFAPILIFEDLQYLETSNMINEEDRKLGSDLLNSLISSLEHRGSSGSPLPIIIETSDSFWADKRALIQSRQSFESILVKGLDYQETKQQIVKDLKLWNEETFSKIWKAFGSFPGKYSQIHAMMKHENVEICIKKILDEMINQIYFELIKCPNQRELMEALNVLQKSNYSISMKDTRNVLHHQGIHFLIEKNILFMENFQIYPQNLLIQHAIEEIINKKKPLNKNI